MATSGLYVNPNTGQTQAGLQQFRNAIINGDMRINQRGTSTNLASLSAVSSTSEGSWVTDRWNVYVPTTGVGKMGQGTSLNSDDLPFIDANIKTFCRVGRTSGNSSTQQIYLAYNLESQDSIRFAGKQVTLSFYYRTGIDFNSGLFIRLKTGTGTDQNFKTSTGEIISIAITKAASINWIRLTFTTTLSSLLNQIFIQMQYAPTGTAGAAEYFDITGVQLELGSVATPFEVRPYPVELQLCQRYYETKKDGGVTFAGDFVDLMFTFSAVKRKNPQVIFYDYIGNISKTTNFYGSASAQTNNIAGATIREVTFYNFRLGASSGGSANTAFISFTADAEL